MLLFQLKVLKINQLETKNPCLVKIDAWRFESSWQQARHKQSNTHRRLLREELRETYSDCLKAYKSSVLSQGNRATQRVFPTPNDSSNDCNFLQVPKSQGCYTPT